MIANTSGPYFLDFDGKRVYTKSRIVLFADALLKAAGATVSYTELQKQAGISRKTVTVYASLLRQICANHGVRILNQFRVGYRMEEQI